MSEPWPRTTWMEAVWSSTTLKPLERLVAAVYADHARDEAIAWVSLTRLQARTGLSRDAANRALRGLVEAGWLVPLTQARQHRSIRYGLSLPSSPGDVPLSDPSGTGDGPTGAPSGTPPDTSGTPGDTSGPSGVPDLSTYPRTDPTPGACPNGCGPDGWIQRTEDTVAPCPLHRRTRRSR